MKNINWDKVAYIVMGIIVIAFIVFWVGTIANDVKEAEIASHRIHEEQMESINSFNESMTVLLEDYFTSEYFTSQVTETMNGESY